MTRLKRSGCVVVVAVLSILAASSPTRAAGDDSATAIARDRYAKGTTFYDLGKYDDAIREFEAAYEAKADPAFLYNLAQSHRLAGHSSEALRYYRTYLRYVPRAPNRADIEERIKTLEKAAANEHTTPATPQPPPTNATPGTPPPVDTSPTPAPYGPGPSGQPPGPGAAYPANPADQGQPPGAPPPAYTPPGTEGQIAPPPAPLPSPHEKSGRQRAGIVIGATGAAVFVVGAVFGLVANAQSKKVEDEAKNGQRFDPAVERLGRTSQTLQWVGYGIGTVAVVAGLVIYATSPSPYETATQQPRVAALPLLSPSAGGALVRVTF